MHNWQVNISLLKDLERFKRLNVRYDLFFIATPLRLTHRENTYTALLLLNSLFPSLRYFQRFSNCKISGTTVLSALRERGTGQGFSGNILKCRINKWNKRIIGFIYFSENNYFAWRYRTRQTTGRYVRRASGLKRNPPYNARVKYLLPTVLNDETVDMIILTRGLNVRLYEC